MSHEINIQGQIIWWSSGDYQIANAEKKVENMGFAISISVVSTT